MVSIRATNAARSAPGHQRHRVGVVDKSAVYELTGYDEKAAELPLPVPVDVMSHALCA